jgi:hypothetical protein
LPQPVAELPSMPALPGAVDAPARPEAPTPAPTLDGPAMAPPATPAPPPAPPSLAPPVDVIDAALAAALERAAAAGQWSTVATLAGELAARRTARAKPLDAPTAQPTDGANVIDLAERRKRGER